MWYILTMVIKICNLKKYEKIDIYEPGTMLQNNGLETNFFIYTC